MALAEWLIRRLHNGGSHLKYPFWCRTRKVDKRWTNTESNNFPAVYLNVLTKHRTGGQWWVTKTGEHRRRTEVVICSSVWHTRGTTEWHILIKPENLKARDCSKLDHDWVHRSAVINPLKHSGSTIGEEFRRCLSYIIVFRRTIFRGVNYLFENSKAKLSYDGRSVGHSISPSFSMSVLVSNLCWGSSPEFCARLWTIYVLFLEGNCI